VLVDTDTGEVESVPNVSLASAHGAGVGSVQFLVEKGVEAVLTQNVGPNAHSALAASGIRIYVVTDGTVADAVEEFRQGLLSEHSGATVPSHQNPSRG